MPGKRVATFPGTVGTLFRDFFIDRPVNYTVLPDSNGTI